MSYGKGYGYIEHGFGSNLRLLKVPIERVTPSGIIVTSRGRFNPDGRERGKEWTARHLLAPTRELDERHQLQVLRLRVRGMLGRLDELSVGQLQAILAVLEVKDEQTNTPQ